MSENHQGCDVCLVFCQNKGKANFFRIQALKDYYKILFYDKCLYQNFFYPYSIQPMSREYFRCEKFLDNVFYFSNTQQNAKLRIFFDKAYPIIQLATSSFELDYKGQTQQEFQNKLDPIKPLTKPKNPSNLENYRRSMGFDRTLNHTDNRNSNPDKARVRGGSVQPKNNNILKAPLPRQEVTNLKKQNEFFPEPSRENTNPIDMLLQAKKGIKNLGGNCYMTSIIQILLHNKYFLQEFLRFQPNLEKKVTAALFNLINDILSDKKSDEINLYEFAQAFNRVCQNYSANQGNNPLSFFTKLIEVIDKENNSETISNLFLFKLKSEITEEEGDEETFYQIQSNQIDNIDGKLFYKQFVSKSFRGEVRNVIIETFIGSPKLLVLNIDVKKSFNNNSFFIPQQLNNSKLKGTYQLVAYNLYTEVHSIS